MRPTGLNKSVHRLQGHLGWVELPILLMVLIIGGATWTFVEIADAVSGEETRQVDEAILLSMRNPDDLGDPVGPLWLEEVGRDVTALGGVAVLVFLTLAVTVYLLLRGQRRAALFVLGAISGGILLSSVLKAGFDRPRPDLVPHASHVYSASFPSGHSLMAAVVYLTLGALLARIHGRRLVKIYFLSIAILLTAAVGISRVYMGVHWPTDVLAGWAAGAVWAVICWMAVLWSQQRGVVEEAPEEEAPKEDGASADARH